ncbi:acyl-CoA dehydrogenase family protein [Rudaeicoccus suwonensis]|uniref:Alkylation response protein AidB-like acyl-CoA dehydrogenase n=1 Tax=Rudaeicoccus suwonensis TaxID=657409 RepID=A0A561E9P4_9MICO|nr:acyl-CoA dehydrogenase family protein [Rudaeicoccus suwonensis]TWE12338.1 alkylation response protein AidB-like acyl-CoA dehydrogenase [Rudaeicoccus suwonensis]
MSNLHTKPTLVDKSQSLGMRLITRVGGLEAMKNPSLRSKVEKALYRGSRQGFKAQTAAGRAFQRTSGAGTATRNTPVKPKREFDLTPTEDQEMIRQAARELAEEVLRPAGAEADTSRSVPESVRESAAQLGMTLLGVPADLGGVAEEASAVTGVLVMEELARGDMGLAVAIMSSAAVANALVNYGDSDQQATFLPPFTDESSPATGALALMEPQPLFDPATPATTGQVEGQELVLSGEKALVPGADSADLFIVSATIDGVPRLVIVAPGTPGLSVSDDPAMGVRAANTGALHLEDVRVPVSNLLGTADDHRDVVARARLAWSAAAVGTAQAVLDHVTIYTKERTAFGEPIAYRQAVAFAVANIAIELEGLRLVVWRAAARLDAGRDAGAQIAHARALTAKYAAQIGSDGVQLLGGHGFVKEFDNERWYRDLRGAGLFEGALLV